ncbi:nucleotide exchange factor GrpE [Thermoanaerobacterium sp. DL9XJH110]|uniref:nucleotide exchange factor GrpE n=1 Tax=Thermoanaerobacterium sp. DL9XJH110 TaxID=3386643 RepID=UPI003BB54EC1
MSDREANKEKCPQEECPQAPTEKLNEMPLNHAEGGVQAGESQEPEAQTEGGLSEQELQNRIQQLEKNLEDKQKEVEKYKNLWLRVQADFDNFRKRTQRDIQEIHLYAGEQLIKDLLPLVDNFERALNSIEDKSSPIYKGIDLIYQQLRKMLEKYNVKEIDAQGKPFDPKFHEAVMMVQSDEYESETVVEVLQKGYLYHSKVIRPSMVKVAKK